MPRNVFFSFEYSDVIRAMVVRNSWVTKGQIAAGFKDKAEFETIKKQTDSAIMSWIQRQLDGTSVTAILVGANTCSSKWVQYEINQSIIRGNGLLGIDISKIKDFDGETTERCGQIPSGYPFYLWNSHDGKENLGKWIDDAAKKAGR